jgi:hypothetical protein
MLYSRSKDVNCGMCDAVFLTNVVRSGEENTTQHQNLQLRYMLQRLSERTAVFVVNVVVLEI